MKNKNHKAAAPQEAAWLDHLIALVKDGYRTAAAENLAVGIAQARAEALDRAADLCLGEPTRLPFKKMKPDHPKNGNYMHYADLVVRLDALAVAIRSLKKASGASARKRPQKVLKP